MKVVLIIKPGFLDKTEEILSVFQEKGYVTTNSSTTRLTQSQCDVIWGDLKDNCEAKRIRENYFREYCDYVMSDEVKCYVIENEHGDYEEVFRIKCELRKHYRVKGYQDLIHTSDTSERTYNEIECLNLL